MQRLLQRGGGGVCRDWISVLLVSSARGFLEQQPEQPAHIQPQQEQPYEQEQQQRVSLCPGRGQRFGRPAKVPGAQGRRDMAG